MPRRHPTVDPNQLSLFDEEMAPISFQEDAGNPSSTSTSSPDEEDNVPSLRSFSSSRVMEAGYDPDAHRLYVRFVKPTVYGGTPWTYDDVPPNVWRNFRRSASPGRFVNRTLNQYNNHRGRWS